MENRNIPQNIRIFIDKMMARKEKKIDFGG